MSPKHRRGEQTSSRLLTAALDVYAAGPENFTMTAVLAASGISSGSLYHHFGSFDGLCAALYSRCMSELLDALINALERSRTARTGIRAMAMTYLRFVQENRAAAHFVHASAYAAFLPAHAAGIAERKAPQMQRIAAWLQPHVTAGRIVDLPQPLIEMLVIGPVAEISRRWLAGADLDLDAAADPLAERIWHAVRADRAPAA